MVIVFNPIGIIHSAYPEPEGTPIQPVFSEGEQGRVEIFPATAPGLPILRAFRISILLYYLHRVKGFSLTCKPFLDTKSAAYSPPARPAGPTP